MLGDALLGPSDGAGEDAACVEAGGTEVFVTTPLRFALAITGVAELTLPEPDVMENVRALEFNGIVAGACGGEPGLRSGVFALP